ncbi:LytR C-terminal domain-containing protein [Microbacterium sp. G2-8]|uniref:LytR C-terminal domain-containing protein n=1 Tax=Microbacterium sp. G2-8 TaxID=2842454 RepID=UPI001C891066|nr:LytR C-terminal domain-containing protein [Microbacterium sp. G2-8]
MPQNSFPRDRFDDVPREPARIGAHRAPHPRFRWVVVLLWWLLAVLVLTGAGILGFLALSQNDTIDLPSPGSAAEQTAEPEAEIDTSYAVLVLNGTGDDQAADAVRQSVLDAGWAEDAVVPFDADATDVATTTVYYSDEADAAAARGLAGALGVGAVEQNAEFDEMSEGGLTVVVGLDRVSAP